MDKGGAFARSTRETLALALSVKVFFILVFIIFQRLIVPRGFLADTVRRGPMPLEAFSMVLTGVSPVRRIADHISAKPLCLGRYPCLGQALEKTLWNESCHQMGYID